MIKNRRLSPQKQSAEVLTLTRGRPDIGRYRRAVNIESAFVYAHQTLTCRNIIETGRINKHPDMDEIKCGESTPMQRMQRMQRGNSYHQGREQLHHYNCLLMPTGLFYQYVT